MSEVIFKDMKALFRKKLSVLIANTADTCDRVDIDREQIILLIVSGLLHELVLMTAVVDADENQFMNICKTSYRHLIKDAKKRLKEAGR
jgi:hypothetical protein